MARPSQTAPRASSTRPADPADRTVAESPGDTPELVKRVLSHPRDENRWAPLRDPAHQRAAWDLLVQAFRDPANRRKEHGIIWADAADDILAAIVGIYGPRASGLVIEATSSPDPDVRAMAVKLVGDPLKFQTPESRKAIVAALKDSSYRVVENALYTLTEVPDPHSGPALLELLDHSPQWTGPEFDRPRRPISDAIIEALGKTGFPGAIGRLRDLTRSSSAIVRAEAAAALAGCAKGLKGSDRSAVIDVFAEMLHDPNVDVCASAARGLADLHEPRGVPALMFQLVRDSGANDDQVPSVDYPLQPTLVSLTNLTGEDLTAAVGPSPWGPDGNGSGRSVSNDGVRNWVARIKHNLEARGFTTTGFPHLPDRLTEPEKVMLSRAFTRWLVDPRGAKMIEFNYSERTAWGDTRERPITGWLFPAGGARRPRVLMADGEELPVPTRYNVIDFADQQSEQVRAALAGKKIWARATDAAWLYRLDHEELAAKILWLARGQDDDSEINVDQPGEDGAWRAFAGAVHAYLVSEDAEALTDAERLTKFYPDYVNRFGPGAALLGELRRRRAEGSFREGAHPPAKAPTTFPPGFNDWAVERRVSQLIHDLQDVNVRQRGQPGGVDLTEDPRVQRLIAIGDPAVPALIDCIANDRRLTRSIHFWRDFAQSRGIIAVREAALVAVESILGTTVFEPVTTGDDFTGRGEDEAQATARHLRAYWQRYGGLPYDRRMMKILTDPSARPEALREAAWNLANFGGERRIGTMVWTTRQRVRPGPSPVVGKFTNPTVAQAILAARDRDIAALGTASSDRSSSPNREIERVDEGYAEDLVVLGDRGIVPELVRRCIAAPSLREERLWALVGSRLGDDRPMRALAAAFEAGRIPLPANDRDTEYLLEQPGNHELGKLIEWLESANTDYCERALAALGIPTHPYAAAALSCAMYALEHPDSDSQQIWLGRPYYVQLLAPMLQDRSRERGIWNIDGEHAVLRDGAAEISSVPLPTPGDRGGSAIQSSAPARRCDSAALYLSQCLVGVPAYHPLLADADARLDTLRDYVSRFGATLRPLRYDEMRAAGFDENRPISVPLFIPNLFIGPRAVTAGDVADGRAIFSSGVGAVPIPGLRLPAVGSFHGGRERVLVVQAERDATGSVRYGVISRHEVRTVTAGEVSKLKPVGEMAGQ